ncbi:MAG: hypothetical protein HN352_05135 [Bacteroidetes bacterium]|nr:hypothetical protein [Bacteroidota bacterium]MBT3750949.1 hypothetical protein [Bacteroidota bacterium]MBT4400313.1 hypothetical protein [Bacteroidota bacterium]MBT4410813.1 hypothetical protein [Bacteroidota bacterium]MBT5426645.1 hypothetical protein [Bacteroidota bacterium]
MNKISPQKKAKNRKTARLLWSRIAHWVSGFVIVLYTVSMLVEKLRF